MQLQDCQNLTPDKVASYGELLSMYRETTVFDGLVKGALTPLKLIRRGGCAVGYEPINPPLVYDDNGVHLDKRIAPTLVFAIFEVAEWEMSWRRLPDNSDIPQFVFAAKIRWQLIAEKFIRRNNDAEKELDRLKGNFSAFKVKTEEKIAAVVRQNKALTQSAESDQALALPEPKGGQEPVFPSGCQLLEQAYDLRARGASPEEIVGELCDGPFHVSAAAARYFAVGDDVLLDDVEKNTEKGVLSKERLNNKRSTNGVDLYKRYKKSLESKECASTRDADNASGCF